MVVSKDNDNGRVKEFEFAKTPELTKWEAFKKAIYDPRTHQFLGRTGKSWGQLFVFYALFYAVLAALFAICMQGLFATLSDKEPKWTLDSSLIGNNPGLGFRPISDRTEEGSLIWYNTTNQTQIQRWVNYVDSFLELYKRNQTGENYVNCDFDKYPAEGQVCVTSVDQLGNCNPERSYGYRTASPCVFLKLNRIFNWQPEFYTAPHPDMPDELKYHIENNTKSKERQQIWVSCLGKDDVDKEKTADFNYYPHGFPGYYYPYKNDKNYLSPIVAVELRNLTPNTIVSIECRAWAKNIRYSGSALDRAGSVTFEVQIDTATS
ncbi:sodium/potassium-transporting ATPase subunit beta-1 [Cylas formicarius]|uniref:sodium/potassium-transporting ATPase subunit beta-1 n=1 Tax=Cylas formicarius TaxID=197179 RepID=UPI002958DE95|nr:sodium/potassium-transporting ATPase subunit beta-1 [Cylas formicarius]